MTQFGGSRRAEVLSALAQATLFDIPTSILNDCITSNPVLVHDPVRLAELESAIRTALLDDKPLPPALRGAALPVLGNIAEAVLETILVEAGWHPVHDDVAGTSFGHGVDLLMLDPSAERLIAIEVKSTTQPSRWPRLPAGRLEQMTLDWLNKPSNQPMIDTDVTADYVHTVTAQVHFRRRKWRACASDGTGATSPILSEDQLHDLTWLDQIE